MSGKGEAVKTVVEISLAIVVIVVCVAFVMGPGRSVMMNVMENIKEFINGIFDFLGKEEKKEMFVAALKCSYDRCKDGCFDVEDNELINCKSDFCDIENYGLWMDGVEKRVCGFNAFQYPVEIELKDDTKLTKSKHLKDFDCIFSMRTDHFNFWTFIRNFMFGGVRSSFNIISDIFKIIFGKDPDKYNFLLIDNDLIVDDTKGWGSRCTVSGIDYDSYKELELSSEEMFISSSDFKNYLLSSDRREITTVLSKSEYKGYRTIQYGYDQELIFPDWKDLEVWENLPNGELKRYRIKIKGGDEKKEIHLNFQGIFDADILGDNRRIKMIVGCDNKDPGEEVTVRINEWKSVCSGLIKIKLPADVFGDHDSDGRNDDIKLIVNYGGGLFSSLENPTLYIASTQGHVYYFVDDYTTSYLNDAAPGLTNIGSITSYDDLLYVGLSNGKIVYYDNSDPLDDKFKLIDYTDVITGDVTSMLVYNDKLYFTRKKYGGKSWLSYYSSESKSGGNLAYEDGTNILSSVVYDEKLFVGLENGALKFYNGGPNLIPTGNPVIDNKAITSMVTDSNRLFYGTENGNILFFDSSSTEFDSHFSKVGFGYIGDIGYDITSMLVQDGKMYVGTSRGEIYSFDIQLDTGSEIYDSQQSLNGLPPSKVNSLVYYNNRLYAGLTNDKVYSYDGSRWSSELVDVGSDVKAMVVHPPIPKTCEEKCLDSQEENGVEYEYYGCTNYNPGKKYYCSDLGIGCYYNVEIYTDTSCDPNNPEEGQYCMCYNRDDCGSVTNDYCESNCTYDGCT